MKILSAGKSSVERAALSVARERGLPTEGRCPITQDYRAVVERNVSAADGTLVLTWSGMPRFWVAPMPAILCSSKPSMGVAVRDEQYIAAAREWIWREHIEVLHVAGHVPFSAAKGFLRLVLNNEAVALTAEGTPPNSRFGFKGHWGGVSAGRAGLVAPTLFIAEL